MAEIDVVDLLRHGLERVELGGALREAAHRQGQSFLHLVPVGIGQQSRCAAGLLAHPRDEGVVGTPPRVLEVRAVGEELDRGEALHLVTLRDGGVVRGVDLRERNWVLGSLHLPRGLSVLRRELFAMAAPGREELDHGMFVARDKFVKTVSG